MQEHKVDLLISHKQIRLENIPCSQKINSKFLIDDDFGGKKNKPIKISSLEKS